MSDERKLVDPHEDALDSVTSSSWIAPDLETSFHADSLAVDSLGVEHAQTEAVTSLRPQSFRQYIGQDRVKASLSMSCQAASARQEPLDHVLLHGPPGLGKTSIARLVAQEMGVGFKLTSGPVIEKAGDLAAILTSLQARDVLFIDEIHRLPRVVEEVLYPALEDYQLDILIGQGPTARAIRVGLQPFTLIGATTKVGSLTSPLRDRFGIVLRMDFYSEAELQGIVRQSAARLGAEIEPLAALEIDSRSRGTPRIANRLLKRVRDYCQVYGGNENEGQPQPLESVRITQALTQECLATLHIDTAGLDAMDRSILRLLLEQFDGGPVGIETIGAAIGEDKETLEDVYEPYLLQIGFLARTKRGRIVTEAGIEHLRQVGSRRNL